MEKKIKIGIVFLIICVISVFLVILYLNRGPRIRPPETLKFEILIDLKTPEEGTISIIDPEDKVSQEDLEVFVGSSHVAGEILDQYYTRMEEYPFSVKPHRENGKVTVSLDFFAENKSEFVGPIYTFKSTSWIPFYSEADITIIFPKDYELVKKETWEMLLRPPVFENGRWKYFAIAREFNEFNVEIEYKKVEAEKLPEGKTSIPSCEDFPNNNIYDGEIADPNFDTNKDAYAFRGQIKKDLEAGINFAGHYTIAQWGCGTECSAGVVVDNKTGTIYSLPIAEFGREFQVNSNLLIVNPSDIVEGTFEDWQTPEWVSTRYFKWENNQFELIHEMKYSESEN